MKRIYSAIGLCAALLIFEAWVFLPSTTAKTDEERQKLGRTGGQGRAKIFDVREVEFGGRDPRV